ncbi:hypothetical protein C1I98_36355, partial [Spongiactinospora gelatinilytica]
MRRQCTSNSCRYSSINPAKSVRSCGVMARVLPLVKLVLGQDRPDRADSSYVARRFSPASVVSSSMTQTPPLPAARPARHRWPALALLCAAFFMVALDGQIVILALPSIQADLGLDASALQWVLSAYLLGFGGLLLLAGRVADLLGHRRLFLAGVVLFLLSSLACGLAGNGGALIAARVAQGVSAAVLSPTALALVTTTFAEGPERNRALAIWTGTGAFGATAALLAGGVLTDVLGWQWIFFINVPVAVAMLALTPVLLRESRATGPGGFDVGGAVTSTTALVLRRGRGAHLRLDRPAHDHRPCRRRTAARPVRPRRTPLEGPPGAAPPVRQRPPGRRQPADGPGRHAAARVQRDRLAVRPAGTPLHPGDLRTRHPRLRPDGPPVRQPHRLAHRQDRPPDGGRGRHGAVRGRLAADDRRLGRRQLLRRPLLGPARLRHRRRYDLRGGHRRRPDRSAGGGRGPGLGHQQHGVLDRRCPRHRRGLLRRRRLHQRSRPGRAHDRLPGRLLGLLRLRGPRRPRRPGPTGPGPWLKASGGPHPGQDAELYGERGHQLIRPRPGELGQHPGRLLFRARRGVLARPPPSVLH